MVADVVTRLVEHTVDVGFERLSQRHTSLDLEPVVPCILDVVHDGRLGGSDGLVDAVCGGLVGDRVSDTDGETVVQKPEVDDALHTTPNAYTSSAQCNRSYISLRTSVGPCLR